MDDKDRVGSEGELAAHLTRLATTVAQTLYEMSTGVERTDITANESTVRIVLSLIVILSVSCVDIRVRNSANPCVRDMSKYLRTCQTSVHGYPADMSIFCNLQLGLLKLQDMPQADIDQEDVSLAGVLQGAVGRVV